MADNDPTKPTPNKQKFKPQNVQDPVRNGSGDRGKPGDTGGLDVEQGSSGVTKQTPSR